MKERPAKGVVGHILYDPRDGHRWFRVYQIDMDGVRRYTDYQLAAEDITVEIKSGSLSLKEDVVEGHAVNVLDWSSESLSHSKEAKA